MSRLRSILWSAAKADLFTPRGMLLRAAALVVVFGICHVAGLRQYTAVLSGSSPGGTQPGALEAVLGGAYVAAYLASVIVAPILAIAAGLLWAVCRLMGGRQEKPDRVA